MGLFSVRARSSASVAHGYHSTGSWACLRRYGLVSADRWFVYFGVPSLFKCCECSVCITVPSPALVAGASFNELEYRGPLDTHCPSTSWCFNVPCQQSGMVLRSDLREGLMARGSQFLLISYTCSARSRQSPHI